MHNKGVLLLCLEFKHIINIETNANLSLRITVPRVSKLRFMWQPSFNLAPAELVWDALSLPARSTKFCSTKNIQHHIS
jgi:hypothetical protein